MKLTKTQEGILNAEEIVGGAVSNICGATFFARRHSEEKLNTAVNTVVRINDAFRLHIDKKTKTQWVEEYSWREYETVCFETRAEFEQSALDYAAVPLDPAVSVFDLKIVKIGKRNEDDEASEAGKVHKIAEASEAAGADGGGESAQVAEADEETGLLYVLHHAICDAWSLSVLRWQLYQILEKGTTPVSFSFLEYCQGVSSYDQSRRFHGDRAYFLNQFRGNREELAAIGPPARSFQSGSLSFEIPSDLLQQIEKYLEKSGVSQYVLLLAAFGICSSRMRDDTGCFYVGTTILNRTTEKELHTIGPLIDDVPLLFDIQRGQTAGQVVRNTDEMVFNAFRHHRFNYPMLQEELRGETSDSRLYEVIFNYQAEYEIPVDYPAQWFRNGTQHEPLQIHVDHRNDRGKRMVTYQYLLEKYTDRDIGRLHRHYMNVLRAVIGDDAQPVGGISLMDEAEKAAMEKLSRGGMRALPEKSLYHLIEEQTGGSVVDGENEYSLSDLKRDAAKIDAAVRRKNRGEAGGETREEKRVIAILCERSYVELAAIYGVIRGGNAYLPISPEFPPERIEAILGISGCDTVLAQRKYRHLVSGALVMEELLDQPDPSPTLPAAALPDDLLYVIFTSGSTGQPKGAMVSNRSAVNRILWMADRYFSPETTVMLKTPYTFDVSVWEIFGFAVAGFRLYILPPFDHYRQDRVIEHIRRGKVTDIHFVPSVFSSFLNVLEESGEELDTLKNIFLSGEALPASLVRRAPAPVHNLYGPTECAVDVTYYDCTGTETDPVPIGFPVDNCRMHVLDKDLQPVPAGVRGQICISGVQVGRGYLHDPARTAERFVPDPFGPGDMYLTGDIGYWNDEGAIVYAGRNDRQVKINGQRIEPEEVETALTQLVPEAAVIVEDNRLIAFYTGGERPSLRKELGRILPAYMIPHSFTHVKEMPRMSSGKTDRGALMKIPREERTYEAPVNGTERAICALFEEVLQKEKVGRNDSFFDLGGTSLDLLSLLSSPLLEQLSPPDMMTHSSPAELAGLLDSLGEAAGSPAVSAGNRVEALSDSRGETTEAPVKSVGSGVNDLPDSRGEAAGPLVPLYLPDRPFRTGIVLFPYAGGDASAYTALVAEFRKRQAPAALYFLPWAEDPDICENLDACIDKSPGSDEDPGSRKSLDTCERLDHCGSPDIWDSLDAAQAQIRKLAERMEIRFYSHCAGSAIALKLLEKLNASQRIVSRYFAGADIPPSRAENLWETVSDRELLDILSQAGMPELPEDRAYDLIARFRSNTREYFDFFGSRREKVPCRAALILSRNDLFTRDYRAADDRWSQYVTEVDSTHYIDAPTHYFQAAEAAVLADILLSDIFSSEIL